MLRYYKLLRKGEYYSFEVGKVYREDYVPFLGAYSVAELVKRNKLQWGEVKI